MRRFMVNLLLVLSGAATAAASEPMPFTDYGSGSTDVLSAGAAKWRLNWGQGPWVWFPSPHPALLSSSVVAIADLHTTAPATISPDLIATLPIAGILTLTAQEAGNDANIIGTMALTGVGVNVIDINAARVFADEATGEFMAPFGKPLHPDEPEMLLTLNEATGIFAGIGQAAGSPWEWHMAGWYAAPLVPGLGLQENIFAVLGGHYPLIGGLMEGVITGQYVPEPLTATLLILGVLAFTSPRRRCGSRGRA